jgi:hypothetical protein
MSNSGLRANTRQFSQGDTDWPKKGNVLNTFPFLFCACCEPPERAAQAAGLELSALPVRCQVRKRPGLGRTSAAGHGQGIDPPAQAACRAHGVAGGRRLGLPSRALFLPSCGCCF